PTKQVDEDVRHQIDLFDDKVLEDREASEIEEDLPPMRKEDELKAPEREREREAARQEELVSHRRRERRRRDERARRDIARAERRFEDDQFKVDEIVQADEEVDEDVRHQIDLFDDKVLEDREASEIEEDLPPMRKEDELKAPEREREREAARQEELVSHRRRERRRRDERARRDIARAERRFEDDQFKVDEIVQADEEVDEDVRHQIDLFDDKVLEDREASEIEEDLPPMRKEDELKAPEREREREAARQEELVSHRRRERRRRDERARRDIARAERRFERDQFKVDEIVQADEEVDDEDVRHQIDLFDDKVLEDREASEIEEDLPPMRKEDELKAPEREREREAARQEELVSHRRRERRRRDERARRDIARAERRFKKRSIQDEDVRHQIDLFDDKVLEDREASEIEEDLPPMRKEDELKAPEREREREAARQEELVSHRRRERRRRDERARRDIARAERRFEDDQFKVDEIVQADEEVLVDEDVRHQIDLFDDKVLEDREASEIEEDLPPMRKEDELKAPEREREREAARQEEPTVDEMSALAAFGARFETINSRSTRLFRPTKKLVDEDVRHQIDLFDDKVLEDREASEIEEDLPPMRKEDELKAPEREREREAARQEELVSHRRRERRRRDERARRDIARAERRFEDDQFKVDEIVQADEEVLVDEDVRHQIDLFDDKVLEDREASEIEEDLPPMRKEDELKAPEREREREAARQEELSGDSRGDEIVQADEEVLVDEDVRHQIDLFDDKVLEDREASEIEEDLPPMRKEDELKAPEREREREAARQEELVSHRRRERRRRESALRAERRFDQFKVVRPTTRRATPDRPVRRQRLEDREASEIEEDLPPMRKEDELKAPEREREREAARQEELVSHRRRERRRRDERARRDIARAERRFEDDQFKVDEIVQADEEVLVDEDVRHQIDLFDDKVLEDREASEIEEDLPPMRKEDELKAPEREREREAARQEELVSHRRRERRRRDERARRDIARAERRFEDDQFKVDEIVQADEEVVDEDVRHQIDLFDDKVLEDREASEIEEDLPPMRKEDELKAPEREREREAARQEELVSHRRRERRRRDERARRDIARAERRFEDDQFKVDEIVQADEEVVDEDVRHQIDLFDDKVLEDREASEIEEDLPPMRKEDELKAPEREREREAARQEELVSHRRRERRRRDERARRDIARAERRFEDDQFKVDEIVQADKQVDEDVRHQIDLFDDKVLEDREASEIEEDLPPMRKEDELKAPEREREREAARQEELVSHRRRERRRRDERARRDIARAERRFEDDQFKVDEIVQADEASRRDVRHQIDLFDDKVLEDREASEIEEDLPPMRKEDELKAPEREREREAARQEELVSHRRRERRRRDERARRDIERDSPSREASRRRRATPDRPVRRDIARAEQRFEEDDRRIQGRRDYLFDDKVLEDREASEIEEDLPRKEDELKAPEREREREAARQEELVDEIVQADKQVDEDVRRQIDLFDDKVLEDREASEIEEDLPPSQPSRREERQSEREREARVAAESRLRRATDSPRTTTGAPIRRRVDEIVQADKQVDEDVRHQIDLFDDKVLEDREASEIEEDLPPMRKEDELKAPEREREREAARQEELVSHRRRERRRRDERARRDIARAERRFEDDQFKVDEIVQADKQVDEDVRHQIDLFDDKVLEDREASEIEEDLPPMRKEDELKAPEREREREAARQEELVSHRRRERRRRDERARRDIARAERRFEDDQFKVDEIVQADEEVLVDEDVRHQIDLFDDKVLEDREASEIEEELPPMRKEDERQSGEREREAMRQEELVSHRRRERRRRDERARRDIARAERRFKEDQLKFVEIDQADKQVDEDVRHQLDLLDEAGQFRGATSVDWAQLESQMERAMRYLEGKIREVHASNDASTDADSVSTASVRKDERPAEYDWDARARWLLDNWTRPELADCGALRLLLGRIIVSQFVARPAQPWSTLRENLAPPPPSPSAAWPDSSDPSLKSESSKVSTGGVCCGSRSGNASRVFYVFNGTVNKYALGFSISVPLSVAKLRFRWANRAGHEASGLSAMPYSIGFSVEDQKAMGSPVLSIAAQGFVPHADSTFDASLPCTGAALAEVPLAILLNVTLRPGEPPVQLRIRRRKLCGRTAGNRRSLLSGRKGTGVAAVAVRTPAALTLLLPLLFVLLVALLAAAAVTYLLLCRCFRLKKASSGAATAAASAGKAAALKGRTLQSTAVIWSDGSDSCSLTSRATSSSAGCVRTLKHARHTAGCYGLVYRGSWEPPHGRGRNIVKSGREEVLIKTVVGKVSVEKLRVERQRALRGLTGRVSCPVKPDNERPSCRFSFIAARAEAARLDQLSAVSQSGVLLAGLQHRHVNPLLASTMPPGDPRPHLIYPNPAGGNLKLRLIDSRAGRPDHTKNSYAPDYLRQTLSTQQLLHMAVQIGKGLAYLHRMQVVHRDLACRNCSLLLATLRSLTADGTVRIGDAALAKDLFPADYECTGDGDSRPVKWLSVEALIERKFSPASDIWSLGVTLWELITRCQQPYSRVDPLEMSRHLRQGFRLTKPINCPDQLFSIMHSCWHYRPDCRPRLKQLQAALAGFHDTISVYGIQQFMQWRTGIRSLTHNTDSEQHWLQLVDGVGDDGLQPIGGQLAGLEHLQVHAGLVKLRVRVGNHHVGDDGEADDADFALPGHDGLVHGAHADHVRAQTAQHSALSRSLEVRPAQHSVDTGAERHSAGCGCGCHLRESGTVHGGRLLIVRIIHRHKSVAEHLRAEALQRAASGEAGKINLGHHPHREGALQVGEALVGMKPALHDADPPAGQPAEHQHAGVAVHRALREMRDVAIADAHSRLLDTVGQFTQARAADDPDLRLLRVAGAHKYWKASIERVQSGSLVSVHMGDRLFTLSLFTTLRSRSKPSGQVHLQLAESKTPPFKQLEMLQVQSPELHWSLRMQRPRCLNTYSPLHWLASSPLTIQVLNSGNHNLTTYSCNIAQDALAEVAAVSAGPVLANPAISGQGSVGSAVMSGHALLHPVVGAVHQAVVPLLRRRKEDAFTAEENSLAREGSGTHQSWHIGSLRLVPDETHRSPGPQHVVRVQNGLLLLGRQGHQLAAGHEADAQAAGQAAHVVPPAGRDEQRLAWPEQRQQFVSSVEQGKLGQVGPLHIDAAGAGQEVPAANRVEPVRLLRRVKADSFESAHLAEQIRFGILVTGRHAVVGHVRVAGQVGQLVQQAVLRQVATGQPLAGLGTGVGGSGASGRHEAAKKFAERHQLLAPVVSQRCIAGQWSMTPHTMTGSLRRPNSSKDGRSDDRATAGRPGGRSGPVASGFSQRTAAAGRAGRHSGEPCVQPIGQAGQLGQRVSEQQAAVADGQEFVQALVTDLTVGSLALLLSKPDDNESQAGVEPAPEHRHVLPVAGMQPVPGQLLHRAAIGSQILRFIRPKFRRGESVH
uniref:Ig-like domain-containing protein n=1 Tax=Macrostomum lignano TaxID=282301 RepID=A0A1I8HPW6_9PLAT